MARIYNPDLLRNIIDKAGIQVATDEVPSKLASSVVPVLVANPPEYCNVIGFKSKSSTGTITAYTSPTDRDFYLNSIQFSWTADVTNDGVLNMVSLDVPDMAVEQEILNIMKNPLVAQHGVHHLTFPKPIKMKRGGNLKMTQTFTAGTGGCKICWSGFTVKTNAV